MIEGEQHEGQHRGEISLKYISVACIASEEGELLAQSWIQCCRELSCKFLQIPVVYLPCIGVIQHGVIGGCVYWPDAEPVIKGVRSMDKILITAAAGP